MKERKEFPYLSHNGDKIDGGIVEISTKYHKGSDKCFPDFFISVLNGPTLLCLSREANEISSSDHEHLFDVTNDVSRGLPCAIAVIAYRRMSVINVTSPKERTRIPLFFPKKEKRKKKLDP